MNDNDESKSELLLRDLKHAIVRDKTVDADKAIKCLESAERSIVMKGRALKRITFALVKATKEIEAEDASNPALGILVSTFAEVFGERAQRCCACEEMLNAFQAARRFAVAFSNLRTIEKEDPSKRFSLACIDAVCAEFTESAALFDYALTGNLFNAKGEVANRNPFAAKPDET